jgi:hypothetical protein
MKKFLKIFMIVVIILFAAIIAIPLVFKSQIMKKVKAEVNKSINAKVEWNDVSISLLSGFPDLKVSLKDLSVVGINNFGGDTLVAFDEFTLKLDLISVFSNSIKIKSIFLDRPVLNAITLKDGSVNYDITIPDTVAVAEEVPADTSSMAMVIKLKKFEVRDGRIYYKDFEGNMSASLEGFNFLLSGDMSEDFTDLNITSTTSSFGFIMDGMKYINNARLDCNSLIKADLVKFIFTFGKTDMKLNDLTMGMEGTFGMPNDTDMDFDIRFFSRETAFKTLLSMVPAIYSKDFAGLKTSGTLSLEGTVKGVMNDTQMPKVDIALLVKDGYFAYPDLPKSVENVNIDVKIFYDGVVEDNTKVDVNKFHLEVAGNPFDMQLHIITPMSDMQMNGLFKGRIDLSSLSDVVPMDDAMMSGTINADINFMGKMSDIDNENYDAFKAEGLLEVMNVKVSGKDLPMPVTIEKTNMYFSPQFVNLTAFDAKLGNSDIHMNGKLENFIPYVFKNETIKGSLNFSSDYLDLNELMADTTSDEEAVTADTSVLTVVEVPKNIDFVMQTDLKKVLYDNLSIDNILGKLIVKDGKVMMEKLSMNMLEGSMLISGEYNTQDMKTPMVDLNMSIKNIDIPSSYIAFNTVQKLAPIAENMRGKISTDLIFTSNIDSAMSPVYNSIVGYGLLVTKEVQITNSETFAKIAGVLKNDKFKDVIIQDINASFEIKNGRVFVKPFDTKLGPAKANIGGDQGLDQTMNYVMALAIPRNEFGGGANDVYQGLLSQASSKGINIKASDDVNVQLKITGTFSDPKIGLDVKESMAKSKAEVKDAVQAKVKEEVAKVKEEVKAKAGAEIDKIMKDAEKQAENVRTTAKEAGDKLVKEAKIQGDNLVKQAGSNPVKKLAAQKTSAELVKKANKNAETLNKEADIKANAILEEARKKADILKAE